MSRGPTATVSPDTMRLGYLTGEYPRATDTYIQREVAGMRERGIQVHTFSVRRTSDAEIVGAEQQAERERTCYLLPVHPVRLLSSHLALALGSPLRYGRAIALAWATRQPGTLGLLYQLFYLAEAGILARQIGARGIQHLHNHFADSSCTVSMLAAELSGITFSFTIHGPYIFFEPHRWRIDEKARRALFVSCISLFCRSQVMIFAPPDCWNRLHIVHCGVDPAQFHPVPHAGTGSRVLYVGRLVPAKGVPVLLESTAHLLRSRPDIELTIIGDGPDRGQLHRLAGRLGLDGHVRILGYRSQSEVREHLQRSHVLVQPSFAEGVPNTLMEAMASGVPIVSTRVAGISELVEHGVSGYLVHPGDVASLTESIRRLLDDPGLRQRFGAAGRDKVEREFNVRREAAWLSTVLAARLRGEEVPVRPDLGQESVS